MQPGPPTSKQLNYLRWLAERTGTTFTPPQTVQEASLAIKHLRARRRTSNGEMTRERRTIARDMATRRGDAAQVTAQELDGYGAGARWAGMPAIAPRVVHCRREEYEVYVGRLPLPEDAPPGSDGFWGNPWKPGRDGTRKEVIERYERYVLSEPRMLERLSELRGKTLGCWCAPKPCHADVLLRLANERELPPPGRNPERELARGRPFGDGLGLG